jgi:hypothetical protein
MKANMSVNDIAAKRTVTVLTREKAHKLIQ